MTAPQRRKSIPRYATTVDDDDIMSRSKHIPLSVRNKSMCYRVFNAFDDILQTLLYVKLTLVKKSRQLFASQGHFRQPQFCLNARFHNMTTPGYLPVKHAMQEEATPISNIYILIDCPEF